MPYVITTRPCAEPPNEQHGVRAEILSRRAVATLEEARNALEREITGTPMTAQAEIDLLRAVRRLLATDSTVGPFPDGTVIEVEAVNSWDLANTGVGGDTLAEIIDAYNAREARA